MDHLALLNSNYQLPLFIHISFCKPWNAMEREAAWFGGKGTGDLESRASPGGGNAPSIRALFSRVSLPCGACYRFSAGDDFGACASAPGQPQKKAFPSVHGIPGRLFWLHQTRLTFSDLASPAAGSSTHRPEKTWLGSVSHPHRALSPSLGQCISPAFWLLPVMHPVLSPRVVPERLSCRCLVCCAELACNCCSIDSTMSTMMNHRGGEWSICNLLYIVRLYAQHRRSSGGPNSKASPMACVSLSFSNGRLPGPNSEASSSNVDYRPLHHIIC